jgi:hypothetical protein
MNYQAAAPNEPNDRRAERTAMPLRVTLTDEN